MLSQNWFHCVSVADDAVASLICELSCRRRIANIITVPFAIIAERRRRRRCRHRRRHRIYFVYRQSCCNRNSEDFCKIQENEIEIEKDEKRNALIKKKTIGNVRPPRVDTHFKAKITMRTAAIRNGDISSGFSQEN